MQRETLAFDRPYEAGLQWLFNGNRLSHDLWLQWQRLNTPDHRERLDAGARLDWRWHRFFSLPLQTHIVHEGGQLFAAGPVRDSFVLASGIALSRRPDAPLDPAAVPRERPAARLDASLELLGLWSHYNPDRQQPARTRDGGGFFGRAAVEGFAWRAHLIMWRGDDYMKDEGDPNYQSLRRDGTRYRGVRDYAEIGRDPDIRPCSRCAGRSVVPLPPHRAALRIFVPRARGRASQRAGEMIGYFLMTTPNPSVQ